MHATQRQPERSASGRANLVVRQACDRDGLVLGYLAERHDGTVEDVRCAARRVSDRMFDLYGDASNIASRMLATDGSGRPRWSISPNFKHIEQLTGGCDVRTGA